MATTNKNFKVKNGLDVGGNTVITGDANVTGKLSVTASAGDEGGEIFLSNAVTNTTITNGVTIDIYKDRLRFFEQGGDARGFYVDITTGGSAASTNLVGGGSASNSFATVSANGTSVVADSSTDTLTITPGDGISITGNSTSDTITFTPNVAGASANGIVTTGTQTFAGEKTFSNTITASANIVANTGFVSADAFRLDTTYTSGPSQAGEITWDPDNETAQLQLDAHTIVQIGQEQVLRVKNSDGANAIPIRTAVMFAGAAGDTVTVVPANSANIATNPSDYLVGITAEEIAADGFGFVTQFGVLPNVNTAAFTLGNLLYVDPANPGQFVTTRPSAPAWQTPVAAVTKVGSGSSGRILVRTIPGIPINRVEGVEITSATQNDVLRVNANGIVVNSNLATAGIANLSGATFTGNVAGTNISLSGNVNATTVNATTFIGSGASLTSIPNSATTANSANGASTIVTRDANGSFTANVVTTTTLVGNTNASTITTGTIANARTNANSANGASTIVARDASGNFTANVITASTLSGPLATTARLELSKTTGQNITDGSTTIVTFPTTVENIGSYTISSGTITLPLTGRYSITAYVGYPQAGTNRRSLSIFNGATEIWEVTAETTSEAGGFKQMITVYSERFAANDTMSIRARQDSGGTISVDDAKLIIDYIGK